MPRRVTIDTKLPIFQCKILNNVLYLNEKAFEFKIVCSAPCFFVIQKMKPLYTFFYSCNQTKSLLSKLLNSVIKLKNTSSTKYATECFLWISR